MLIIPNTQNIMETKNITFKARIVGKPSKEIVKSTGAIYVLIDAEILEGPAKGKFVPASRTILTGKKEVRTVPEIGAEVTLSYEQLPSTTTPGKFVHFFNIATGVVKATNDELTDLFSASAVASQKL